MVKMNYQLIKDDCFKQLKETGYIFILNNTIELENEVFDFFIEHKPLIDPTFFLQLKKIGRYKLFEFSDLNQLLNYIRNFNKYELDKLTIAPQRVITMEDKLVENIINSLIGIRLTKKQSDKIISVVKDSLIEETISVKDQFYKNKSKIDSNDRRQIEYLNKFEEEHNEKEF